MRPTVSYWLVMAAAGSGRRFGSEVPKQYAPLAGRTVLEWALAPFLDDRRCSGIAVALGPEDRWWPELSSRLPAVIAAQGGAERVHSVRNALSALSRRARPNDWVLVHDAARPCLTREDLDRLLDSLASHAVGGLLATPVADTLKQAASQEQERALEERGTNGPASALEVVEATVDRSRLWRALTPQMFRYQALTAALEQAIAAQRWPSDDSQAMEWAGARPALVRGSPENIKVTTAEDLRLAEALLAGRITARPSGLSEPPAAGRSARS